MDLNKYIDHTILKANATRAEIEKLCAEAKENNFASVCIQPYFVNFAKTQLAGSDVKVCTVIGFPLGQNCTEVKVFETAHAVENGADEIDMVINVSALLDGNLKYVENEIKEIVAAAAPAIVKVIIETCYLNEEQKVAVTKIVADSGAKFVKTSTGFGTLGATVEDVQLLKSVVNDKIEVKAAGGIRDKESCLKMIDAGATRIGTSSGIKICKE